MPGYNVARALFWALNINTHRWDRLLSAYPSSPIILIVDNYSGHSAHLMTAWIIDPPPAEPVLPAKIQLAFEPRGARLAAAQVQGRGEPAARLDGRTARHGQGVLRRDVARDSSHLGGRRVKGSRHFLQHT